MIMGERRFGLSVQTGCITHCEAMGVMVKGGDAHWRCWIQLDGRGVPGEGDFPSTRDGRARLQRRVSGQLWASVFPPPRMGLAEGLQ